MLDVGGKGAGLKCLEGDLGSEGLQGCLLGGKPRPTLEGARRQDLRRESSVGSADPGMVGE